MEILLESIREQYGYTDDVIYVLTDEVIQIANITGIYKLIVININNPVLITQSLFDNVCACIIDGGHIVINHLNSNELLRNMTSHNLDFHPIIVDTGDGICVYRPYELRIRKLMLCNIENKDYKILPISLSEFTEHIKTEIHKFVLNEIPAVLNKDITYINEKSIDIIICGCGRPAIFRNTIEKLKENLIFDGKLNYCYEEGLFQVKTAKECLDIAREHGFIYYHAEFINSYGHAITNILNNASRSKYIFFIEDDMECIQPIDLNQLWTCLEQNTWINQIRFVRGTCKIYGKITDKLDMSGMTGMTGISDLEFTESVHWYFNPGIWRMSFIRENWSGDYRNIHHGYTAFLLNKFFPTFDLCDTCISADNLCINCRSKNMTYKLGCITLSGKKRKVTGKSFFRHCDEASIHVAKGSV